MHTRNTDFVSRPRLGAFFVLVAVAASGLRCADAAEDATCKLVFDAMEKAVVTPSREFVTLKMDVLDHGKPAMSERINTGKEQFIQTNGKWKLGVSAQAVLAQMRENRKSGNSTCRFVRDETVDDLSASLYTVHEEEGPDSTVWLAKASGLPVRAVYDVEGTHSEIRYVYGAVSAPPLN